MGAQPNQDSQSTARHAKTTASKAWEAPLWECMYRKKVVEELIHESKCKRPTDDSGVCDGSTKL
eukprot:398405-Amphidinium_carterae.1